jgi:hypothetical protein
MTGLASLRRLLPWLRVCDGHLPRRTGHDATLTIGVSRGGEEA